MVIAIVKFTRPLPCAHVGEILHVAHKLHAIKRV